MLDILQESIKGYNLPFTILLGVVAVYWIIALFGLVDIDGGGDADLDLDVNVDGDADVDVDPDASADGSSGFLDAAFKIIGLTDAPLLLILSILSLMLWGLNLMANLVFNQASSASLASILVIPVFIIAIILTRLLIRPLRPVMKMFRGTEAPAQIIGKEGKVISATLDQEFGRIEIDFDGKPLLLKAVVSSDQSTLKKGDSILVVEKIDDSNTYIVRPL